jgi:hypothetical protein
MMPKMSVTKPQTNPSYTGIPGIANKIKGGQAMGGKLNGNSRAKSLRTSRPAGRIPAAKDGNLSYA